MRLLVYHYLLDYAFPESRSIGGGEVLTYYLLSELHKRGHQVTLLTHSYNPTLFLLHGIETHLVPLLQERYLTKAIRYTLPCMSLLGLEGFDACLLLHPLPLPSVAILLAKKFPAVWYHIKPFFRAAERAVPQEPTLTQRELAAAMIRERLGRLGGVLLAHTVKRILSLSNYMSNMIDKYYLNVRSMPIYAGIPEDRFTYSDVVETKEVLFVGRLSAQKNIFRVLRAFKQCHDRIPDATLRVVAKGTRYQERRFENTVEELSLADYVIWDKNTDVALSKESIYEPAQVVVYPTVHEAFGLVVLEAMATGRPVITSSFGGPAEIVGDSQCGLLVDPYDEHSIADAMITLLDDYSMCNRLGVLARRRFEANFTIERVAEKVVAGLQGIVPSAPPI
jgi:glycosyltransferase involved in cell wall biosynthesis